MGNSSSLEICAPKTVVTMSKCLRDIPYGSMISPVFYSEDALTLFYQNNLSTSTFTPSLNHTAPQLAELLYGSYEQLPVIGEILDEMILATDPGINDLIARLEVNYKKYAMFATVRTEMSNTIREFSPKFYTPFTEAAGKLSKDIPAPKFPNILHALSESYKSINNEEYNKTELKEITTYLTNCTPASSFPPPTPGFLPKVRGHNELFTARYVNCHGISSNGQFLFVLCADKVLQIFPLLNMGAMMHPIQVLLNISDLDYTASLIACKMHIYIHVNSKLYVYDIIDLITADPEAIIEPKIKSSKSDKSICYASDGVVYARIDRDFSVKLFEYETNEIIRTVKLERGNAILHPAFPRLFPNVDYSTVPIVINGTYIAFILRIDPTTTLFRLFSLVKGTHVHDEVIKSADQFYAACTDSMHKCHWVISLMENKLGVRRFYFAGSLDPAILNLNESLGNTRGTYNSFIAAINRVIVHYIGSQIVSPMWLVTNPSEFIDLLKIFKDYLDLRETMKGHDYQLALQVFTILTDTNLRLMNPKVEESKEMRELLYCIIAELPNNLAAFLYFGSLRFLLFDHCDFAISLLVGLFMKLENNTLISYAIKQIQSTFVLAFIPFSTPNTLSKLLPNDLVSVSKMIPQYQTLLLLHQRVLVISTIIYLESDEFTQIHFRPADARGTALDYLSDYAQILLNNFDTALSTCKSIDEITDSAILMLFSNFITLLSAMSDQHIIAQLLTSLFSVIMSKIASFIKEKKFDIASETHLGHIIRSFVMLYAKLMATLLQGGTLSDFETQFTWLISQNLDLVEDEKMIPSLISNNESFDDMRIQDFIEKDNSVMENIYKKFKPMMNRKLSDDVKYMDRLCVSAICGMMGIMDELLGYDGSKPFSTELRSALDQMLRVRNEIRSLKQNKLPTDDIHNKCLMLHRMQFKGKVTARQICDFIFTKQTPEIITKIIRQQRIRNDLTLVGFALVEEVLKMTWEPMFIEIFSYALQQIKSFSGLASIIQISALSKSQISQIKSFLMQILSLINWKPQPKLVLVLYRFFRDCTMFYELELIVFNNILKILDKDPERVQLFGLLMSLADRVTEIPEPLRKIKIKSPYKMLITAEVLKKVQCDEKLFKKFLKIYWKTPESMFKPLSRLMYHMLKSTKIKQEHVVEQINKMMKYVGENIDANSNYEIVSEMVWVLRWMLYEQSHLTPLLKNIILSTAPNEKDENKLTAIFAILNGYIEPVRSYCNIKIHTNRTSALEYIAIPTDKRNEYLCYSKPFSLAKHSHKLNLSPSPYVYTLPIFNLSPASWNEYEFIMSFFKRAIHNAAKTFSPIYARTVASFMKFSEFSDLINEEHVLAFKNCLLSFRMINNTLNLQRELDKYTIIPEVCGFSQLHYVGNPFKSLISLPIYKKEPFTVKFNAPTKCYFGIISDTLNRIHTRYSLISYPNGIWTPFNAKKIMFSEEETEIEFQVFPENNCFTVHNQNMLFPYGVQFKVLISVPIDVDINIEVSGNPFSADLSPTIEEYGMPFYDHKETLYTVPQEIHDIENTVWTHIDRYPDLNLTVDPMSIGEKVMKNYIEPPDFIPIHPGFSTDCSEAPVRGLFRAYNKTLTQQWSSVIMARILRYKPELLTDGKLLCKIFSLLVTPLEQFSISLFSSKQFPFYLSAPIWSENTTSNCLYMGLEVDAKKALRNIVKKPEFPDYLSHAISSFVSSKSLHLVAYPHACHVYYPPGSYNSTLTVQLPNTIIAPNTFDPIIFDAYTTDQNKESKEILPAIIPDAPVKINLSPSVMQNDLSIFTINFIDNSWIYNTAFELLLMIKNFIFLDPHPIYRTTMKSVLIDCFICQSPLVLRYLPFFMDHIELHLPPTPFDKKRHYITRLQMLGTILKHYKSPWTDSFVNFYHNEQSVLTSKYASNIACFFPEFFSVPVNQPGQLCSIPKVALDPGAIKTDFESYIRMLRVFDHQYASITGFPFWDILPFWLRITGAWDEGSDHIDASLEPISREVMHLTNPSLDSLHITFHTSGHFNSRSIIMYAETPTFEDTTFIRANDANKPINFAGHDLYFALVDVPHNWSSVRIKFTTRHLANNNTSIRTMPNEMDPRVFHDHFLSDMKDYVVKWTPDHTAELVLLLPRYALRQATFTTVQAIAKQSTLISQFPITVILLKALVIHHFNYIRYKHRKDVPEALWASMSDLVSIEDAADTITEAIHCGKDDSFATFSIDRHAAQRLIVDGGNPSHSIISQLTNAFNKHGVKHFQCKKRPWKVKFVGEQAIDAGGPSRELMTEAAASIFEPTTQLCIPVPNARKDVGQYKETFIPFDKTGRRLDDYRSIGIFLGIVLRSGYSQDLPFAPIVWKYLAKEKIGINDVLAIDESLDDHFKHMKDAYGQDFENHFMFPWTIENWDGQTIPLPGHSSDSIVSEPEIEKYIKEAIQFRINAIFQPLKYIRKGLRQNVGFKRHELLSGTLLARMAQGTPMISTEHLKSITTYSSDFEGGVKNPHIQHFWHAVERLTEEQKKLMLKFITTLTRLPNPSINPDFKLQIDKLNTKNSDLSLPTASTCFNRLHLPTYSSDEIAYQKLTYAIQFCMTMENQ